MYERAASPRNITNNIQQVLYCGRNGFDVEDDRAWLWAMRQFFQEDDPMDSEFTYF